MGPDDEWRRYCAALGDNPDMLRLSRHRIGADWSWHIEYRELAQRWELPGGDLPDAEAQALAVPTLVRALKAVLERLEEGR